MLKASEVLRHSALIPGRRMCQAPPVTCCLLTPFHAAFLSSQAPRPPDRPQPYDVHGHWTVPCHPRIHFGQGSLPSLGIRTLLSVPTWGQLQDPGSQRPDVLTALMCALTCPPRAPRTGLCLFCLHSLHSPQSPGHLQMLQKHWTQRCSKSGLPRSDVVVV